MSDLLFRSLILLVLILCIGALILYLRYTKKPKIKACHLQDFACIRKSLAAKKVSDKEKIIDYDKLYHKILLKAGYTGKFGEILKKNPREITDINKIWKLHKTRNTLVHEFGTPEGVSLFQIALEYKKEVDLLLSRFKK